MSSKSFFDTLYPSHLADFDFEVSGAFPVVVRDVPVLVVTVLVVPLESEEFVVVGMTNVVVGEDVLPVMAAVTAAHGKPIFPWLWGRGWR